MSTDFDGNMSGLLEQLEAEGLCKPGEVRGCTEEEIEWLEQKVGLCLPLAYKSYLRAMGKGAGDLFVGTDIFLLQVPGLSADAADVLRELDPSLQLPPDAFVFGSHQGYIFYYLRTLPPEDNPPVYGFTDDESPKLISGSFTGFLDARVRNLIAFSELRELWRLHSVNRQRDPEQAYVFAKQYITRSQESGQPVSKAALEWVQAYERDHPATH